MSSAYLVGIGLNISALVFTFLIFIASLMSGNIGNRLFRSFSLLALFSFLTIVVEACTALLFGTPGDGVTILIRSLDYLTYVFSMLQMFFFSVYFYEYIKMKTKISAKALHLLYALCGLGVVYITFMCFFGVLSYYDEYNYYYQTEYYILGYIFFILIVSTCIVLTLVHRKALNAREVFILLFYLIIPYVSYIAEALFEDVWVSNFTSAISVFLVYVTIQVDLMQKFKMQNTELLKNRIAIMLSQIRPHFLYNVLSSISDLTADSPEAQKAILAFSKYLRVNMDALTQKELIPFEKELEHVKQYLWLEKMRFEDKLTIVYDIQSSCFAVPVLTVQPIVENAVLHGITTKEEGGTVTIHTEEDDRVYRVVISDDGTGYDPAALQKNGKSHVGIANVGARLTAMCAGELTIESIPGKGTIATMIIPKVR